MSEAGSFRLAQGAALGSMDLETGSAVLSRKVVWLREYLILVHDEIYANPKDKHKIVQRWHFSPDAQVMLKGQTAGAGRSPADGNAAVAALQYDDAVGHVGNRAERSGFHFDHNDFLTQPERGKSAVLCRTGSGQSGQPAGSSVCEIGCGRLGDPEGRRSVYRDDRA